MVEIFFFIVLFGTISFIRNEIVYKAVMDQIEIDLDVYIRGPKYFEMLFDLTKWTRKQLFNTEV